MTTLPFKVGLALVIAATAERAAPASGPAAAPR